MNISLSYFAESSSSITSPVPNSVNYKEDTVEKSETDSLRKETVLSEFKYKEHSSKSSSLEENKYKQESTTDPFPGYWSVFSRPAEVEEKAVKIVTSVSINDMENSSPKVIFQQSRELSSENLNNSSTPVTSIFNINCNELHMKLEIQETLQVNAFGVKSTCTLMTEKMDSAEKVVEHKSKQPWMPDYQSSEQLTPTGTSCNKNRIITPSFTFGSMSKPTENQTDTKPVCSTNIWGKLDYCQCCSSYPQQKAIDLSNPANMFNYMPQGERKYNEDQLGHLPPPQRFADRKYNTLDDLTGDLASFRFATCSPADKHQRTIHWTSSTETGSLFSGQAEEREDMTPFDLLSESDNNEPMFMRPSICTNRSRFTNDFIYCQRRKSWISKSSIAVVKNRICSLPKKRRQTFPGTSEGPFNQSFSFLTSSLPFQTERSVKHNMLDERLSTFEGKETCEQVSKVPKICKGEQPFLKSFSFGTSSKKIPAMCPGCEQHPSQSSKKHEDTDLKQSTEDLHTSECERDQRELVDMGLEMRKVYSPEPSEGEVNQKGFSIQVVRPPCSDSEEQMVQNDPSTLFKDGETQGSNTNDCQSPVNIPQTDLKPTLRTESCAEKSFQTTLENVCESTSRDTDGNLLKQNEVAEKTAPKAADKTASSPSVQLLQLKSRETNDMNVAEKETAKENPNKPSNISLHHTDKVVNSKEMLFKTGKVEKQRMHRCKS